VRRIEIGTEGIGGEDASLGSENGEEASGEREGHGDDVAVVVGIR